MRIIRVPPGIGDSLWIIQKLLNTGEKFDFQLSDKKPQRGKQVFDLLPQLARSCNYTEGLPHYKENAYTGLWKDIKAKVFTLECNTHLEEGRRIEAYLPDLPTSYRIDYKTSYSDHVAALKFVPNAAKINIGIYGSSYSARRAWNFWDENGWFELIYRIHAKKPDFRFVIIGADWDLDLGKRLIYKLQKHGIDHVSTIGQPLGTVIEVMKRLNYFFGFPSGLSILNETIGKDGMMFYPPHLTKMIGTWCHPDRYGNGFKECLFCSPKIAYKWWKENVRL